ncbi:MAG: 4-(cytidine 5'-diphospho)-2-C-methyl-D-erythritol kinase [Bacteroidales bacterium]|nr:4-(cytidine 5'-diphospho)-2-C-methyl-D-erythritol kinase [Bacteroidales bacterium]
MTFQAPCKINLGLNLVGRRPDGYHLLETVFVPVSGLFDSVEVTHSSRFSFSQQGIPVPGPDSDNLCCRAYNLLRQRFPDMPAVSLSLTKRVPFGAGLGGGSSDAATVLLALNESLSLGLSPLELHDIALQLGADCPFFLLKSPAFAEGVGEILHPISLPQLHSLWLVIVKPPFAISTKQAYQGVKVKQPEIPLLQALEKPLSEWPHLIFNDFEESLFETYPDLCGLKDALYSAGALYASLSGSGSALFGLFPSQPDSLLPCEIHRQRL